MELPDIRWQQGIVDSDNYDDHYDYNSKIVKEEELLDGITSITSSPNRDSIDANNIMSSPFHQNNRYQTGGQSPPPSHFSPQFTTINGKGLWNSWKRNFKTPLLALLDLIDNSLDAALSVGHDNGKIHVERSDSWLTPASGNENVGLYDKQFCGLCMTNMCVKPVKPLQKVLEVYNSSKGKDSVGENGVGIKQGCATLSDLSFVFSRNRNVLELGVLAKTLQRAEGCRLPSFVISLENCDDDDEWEETITENLESIYERDADVGKCIHWYGDGNDKMGIAKLARNFLALLYEGWGDHSFRLVLVDLLHTTGNGSVDQTMSNRSTDRSHILMSTLKEQLPQTYIHIPSTFEFKIDGGRINFCYWLRRLVELSQVTVSINTQRAYKEFPTNDARWRYPDETSYKLNIFLGFDPLRIKNENQNSSAALYVYSRQSGRLIKHNEDARQVLGLNASGTDYCQGLTVIVDDETGRLPLNPTKQDISFGEEKNGAAHQTNLYGWIGAVVSFYWKSHSEKFEGYGAKKTIMTEKILDHYENILMELEVGQFVWKTLGRSQLTVYSEIQWTKKKNRINLDRRQNMPYRVTHGKGTKFLIEKPCAPAPDQMPKKRKKYATPNNMAAAAATSEDSLAYLPADKVTSSDAINGGEGEKKALRNLLRIESVEKKRAEDKLQTIQREMDAKTKLLSVLQHESSFNTTSPHFLNSTSADDAAGSSRNLVSMIEDLEKRLKVEQKQNKELKKKAASGSNNKVWAHDTTTAATIERLNDELTTERLLGESLATTSEELEQNLKTQKTINSRLKKQLKGQKSDEVVDIKGGSDNEAAATISKLRKDLSFERQAKKQALAKAKAKQRFLENKIARLGDTMKAMISSQTNNDELEMDEDMESSDAESSV
eukprot:CAMPEP_0194370214 /NCGR_PEP_ID=MMETSP0174-20130528/18491_1 /TAXON_ID=216777 /ORGANISM="Proboscia alata, Strain PI-D3" /LENGTH=888 /DNA_ID=CAMNT_0039147523 /DNA_START=63 /DNA_END=2729 /DNA_ORIENTATION=-